MNIAMRRSPVQEWLAKRDFDLVWKTFRQVDNALHAVASSYYFVIIFKECA